MPSLHEAEIQAFIEGVTSADFFKKKITKLKNLTLSSILARKNPYLYKAKGCDTPEQFIQDILDADSSSGEEGIFGNLLEQLAIFVCEKSYGGWKSGTPGIDLEFNKDGVRYLVSVKSGPKWSNSASYSKLQENFRSAVRVIGTSGGKKFEIVCVEGCCYGKEAAPKNSDHLKLCGQAFWELISGDDQLYKKICHAFGKGADMAHYESLYAEKKTMLVQEFRDKFCRNEIIDWDRLLEHNSGAPRKAS